MCLKKGNFVLEVARKCARFCKFLDSATQNLAQILKSQNLNLKIKRIKL